MSDLGQSIMRFGNSLGNAVNQVYQVDARRKTYDAQNAIADMTEEYKRSLLTNPNYGQVEMPDMDSWISDQLGSPEFAAAARDDAAQGRDTPAAQQYRDAINAYSEAVENAPKTGYMAGWEELTTRMQQEIIDKLDNPLAREQAQGFLDSVRRDEGSRIYGLQVAAWKEDLTAKNMAEIDQAINRGADFETIMGLAQQNLDDLRNINAISPAEYNTAMANYADKGIGRALAATATATLTENGLYAARNEVLQANQIYTDPSTGTQYQVTDGARAYAQNVLAERWQMIEDQEDARLQSQYEAGTISVQSVERANIGTNLTWTWYSRLAAKGNTPDEPGLIDGKPWASELFQLYINNQATPNELLATIPALHREGKIDGYTVLEAQEFFLTTLKEKVPEFGTMLDDIEAIMVGKGRAQIRGARTDADVMRNPEYIAASSQVLAATADLYQSVRFGQLNSAQVSQRITQIRDTAIGLQIELANPTNLQITYGTGGQADSNQARNLHAKLATSPDLVIFDDVLGRYVWSKNAEGRYNNLVSYEQTMITQDYGLTVGPPTFDTEPLSGDALPVPVFSDASGKSYKFIDNTSTRSLELYSRTGNGEWVKVAPAAAQARAAATEQRRIETALPAAQEAAGGTIPLPQAHINYFRGDIQAATEDWANLSEAQRRAMYRGYGIIVPGDGAGWQPSVAPTTNAVPYRRP